MTTINAHILQLLNPAREVAYMNHVPFSSLPEIMHGGLALNVDFGLIGKKTSSNNCTGGRSDTGADDEDWMNEELMQFLDTLPQEFQMFDDVMNIPLSDDDLSEVTLPEEVLATVFEDRPRVTFATLPSAKTFSHLSVKTPEMVRDEKLHAFDSFVGALNGGDVFGLHSLIQSQCEPDVQFHYQNFGFNYCGWSSLFVFWALIFEKHYEGRVSLLQSRLNSAIKPHFGSAPDSGVFESVDFVVKLEASRLTSFQSFDCFHQLMESGLVQAGLSLPELMEIIASFPMNHQQQHQSQNAFGCINHHLYRIVYIFEFNLRFHAIKHTITHWSMDLIAVDQR